jgi:hypothetical protein
MDAIPAILVLLIFFTSILPAFLLGADLTLMLSAYLTQGVYYGTPPHNRSSIFSPWPDRLLVLAYLVTCWYGLWRIVTETAFGGTDATNSHDWTGWSGEGVLGMVKTALVLLAAAVGCAPCMFLTVAEGILLWRCTRGRVGHLMTRSAAGLEVLHRSRGWLALEEFVDDFLDGFEAGFDATKPGNRLTEGDCPEDAPTVRRSGLENPIDVVQPCEALSLKEANSSSVPKEAAANLTAATCP